MAGWKTTSEPSVSDGLPNSPRVRWGQTCSIDLLRIHWRDGGRIRVKHAKWTRLPVEAVKETWPEKVLPHPSKKGIVLRHFVEDTEADGEVGEGLVKVIPNDWPYGVPAGSTHWGMVQTTHPPPVSLHNPRHTFRQEPQRSCTTASQVTASGVSPVSCQKTTRRTSGEVRGIAEVVGTYSQSRLDDTVTRETVSKAHAWAARYVTKFVEAKWPTERFETAWFCNPPNLRTVPGLSHFQ